MVTLNQDYRALLRDEMERRCQRNKNYSQRAFARDLGLTSARLSEILHGKSGLSLEAARAIAERLGFKSEESEYFADLVESMHGRSKLRREIASARLQKYMARYHQISLDTFKVISEWYCFAILSLLEVDGFQPSYRWISTALEISVTEAKDAVERLERLQLLDRSDASKWKCTHTFTASPDGVPSDWIKQCQKQLLTRALDAIHAQEISERDVTAVILSVDSSRLEEAKAMIKEFRRNFDRKLGTDDSKDRVYCLAVQFFNLTHGLVQKVEKSI